MHLHESRPPPRGPWKRIVLGVLAAAVLLPIPAAALTFLGSWSVTQFQTGGAPAAAVTSSDAPGGGTLSVGMGSYSAPSDAVSAVTAVRTFRVASQGETVSLARSFNTTLQNAGLLVQVRFQRLSGRTNWRIPDEGEFRFGTARQFRFDRTNQRSLTGGLYQAVISVTHFKLSSGLWNNATPYRFTFSTL